MQQLSDISPWSNADVYRMSKTACITNAVRVFEILGVETAHRHLEFFERAQEVGLIVIPGFSH